jgi:hypothetical protein
MHTGDHESSQGPEDHTDAADTPAADPAQPLEVGNFPPLPPKEPLEDPAVDSLRYGVTMSETTPRLPAQMLSDPAFAAARNAVQINARALSTARRSVEDVLVMLRDSRISSLTCGNGLVIRETDGTDSSAIRLSTVDALEIGIRTYIAALQDATDRSKCSSLVYAPCHPFDPRPPLAGVQVCGMPPTHENHIPPAGS